MMHHRTLRRTGAAGFLANGGGWSATPLITQMWRSPQLVSYEGVRRGQTTSPSNLLQDLHGYTCIHYVIHGYHHQAKAFPTNLQTLLLAAVRSGQAQIYASGAIC